MNTKAKGYSSVDHVPSFGKLSLLSLQHVLAFYAGAVIVPLLIAGALNLDAATTIHLINADLFTCGIATLIQTVGIGKKVGVRLPIIQGVTTTAVAPIVAIGLTATNGGGGMVALPTIYGAVIVSGLVTFIAAPYFAKLLRFFPPVVTGSVLVVMGTTLLAVSANDFTNLYAGGPAARDILYGFGTLLTIVLVQRFFSGFFGTIAVLIGLVGGTVVAAILGHLDPADIDSIGASSWLGVTTPFYFGVPVFSLSAIFSMIIVMLITMVETTGDTFATGEIVGKRITKNDIAAAIRADGLSTTLGGVMNSFPYTMFAQNVGLVRLTGVRSRWVAAGAGTIMIVLGLLPKAGALVNAIPAPVLGGASLALFANVAWVGLQTIAKADMFDGRNATIVTTALGLAMLVTFRPEVAALFPTWAQVFVSSGMSIGAITAILLNLLFFHTGRRTPKVFVASEGEKVSLEDVNNMDRDAFVSTFRTLFNNETWPLEAAWETRPFASEQDVRDAIQSAVLRADIEAQRSLIRDYPSMFELVTADDDASIKISRVTGSLALESASATELDDLEELSERYSEKFGQPYVAWLEQRHTVPDVIAAGVRRLGNSPAQEHITSLHEIVEIANDRLDVLLRDANPIQREWDMRLAE